VNKIGRQQYHKLAVIVLIMVYIGLSVASALVTKLRYGPDEPAHFIYVREIGEHLRLPKLSHEETHVISLHSSHEAHQPPLYYILAAVPYYVSRSLGADVNRAWLVVRLFSSLLGAGWIYFLYRLSREFLIKGRITAVIAAACIGLMPLSTYIGGVVNNDVLISMLFTAGLWLIVRTIRRDEISRKSAFQIGIVSGLAVLAKSQGLFLLPVIAVACLIIAHRRGWKDSIPSLGNAAIAILVAVLVSSIWFVRNWYVYGTFIIQSLHNPLAQSDGLGIAGWIFVIQLITSQVFDYFWTPFWLVKDFVDYQLYHKLLMAFCVFVAVGVFAHLRSCRCLRSTEPYCRSDAWALMALPGVLIYIFLFRHTLWVDRGALQQGRLLLPAAGILALAIVIALKTLIKRPVLKAAVKFLKLLKRGQDVEYDVIRMRVDIILGALLIIMLLTVNLCVLNTIAAYYRLNF